MRVLDIFEVLAAEPAGLTFPEFTARLGWPKSSLHALLGALLERAYLAFDEDSRRYSIGVQLFDQGQGFLRQHPETREAREAMAAVVAAVNETCQLGLLRGAEGVNLATVECSHPLRLQLTVGRHFDAHATSLGKTLLAYLPDEEVRRRIGTGALARHTAHTFAHIDDLLVELARIRARGFSLDTEESILGVFCVGVPVFNNAGDAMTGMSVTIPTSRLNMPLLAAALSNLARASLAISTRIGARSPSPLLHRLASTGEATRLLEVPEIRSLVRTHGTASSG